MRNTTVKRFKKGVSLLLATTLVAALGAQTAFAATTITKVSVSLNVDVKAGEALPSLSAGFTGDDTAEIRIPESSKYSVESWEWTKDDVEEAELGKKYSVKIVLDAESGYEFRSSYSSSKVSVKGADFVSAKINSDDDLVVTLKTREAEGVLAEPDDVRWLSYKYKNEKFGQAKWDSVDDASYDVTLYRNDKLVHRESDWSKTSINFYPYMTKEGDYTFRVRAIPRNENVKDYAEKSEWVYSDELYVDEDEVSDGSGQGVETDDSSDRIPASQVGWIKSGQTWYFKFPDGTYLRDSWGKIDDKWYLFGSSGEMLTGWHNRNGLYYFMNSDGAMHTGWLLNNNNWYYLNPNGDMRTGWLTLGNLTYCLDANGAMMTGWREVDGQFYYFYPDGHKAVNEVISGFYVDHNGVWKRP